MLPFREITHAALKVYANTQTLNLRQPIYQRHVGLRHSERAFESERLLSLVKGKNVMFKLGFCGFSQAAGAARAAPPAERRAEGAAAAEQQAAAAEGADLPAL